MSSKTERTIVVLRAPERPLVCLRASDLPVPLDIGQVYDFDGVLYQQTHKAIVCVGRLGKGTINDANTMLKALISRLYGPDELTATLSRGTINFSAVSATNETIAPGGIRIGVMKLLADDGEDLVYVNCRVVNGTFLRQALATDSSSRGGSSVLTLGLEAPDLSAVAKPTRLTAETSPGPAKSAGKRIRKGDKT